METALGLLFRNNFIILFVKKSHRKIWLFLGQKSNKQRTFLFDNKMDLKLRELVEDKDT